MLEGLSLAFQAAGLLIAVIGLWRTWSEFAGEGLLAPLIGRIRVLLAPAESWLRRLLGRPKTAWIHAGDAVTFEDSATARIRVGYPELPSGTSQRVAIAELDRVLRHLIDTVTSHQEQTDVSLGELRQQATDLHEELHGIVLDLIAQDRHIATEGLRLELVGLALVAVGLVFQAASQIIA